MQLHQDSYCPGYVKTQLWGKSPLPYFSYTDEQSCYT